MQRLALNVGRAAAAPLAVGTAVSHRAPAQQPAQGPREPGSPLAAEEHACDDWIDVLEAPVQRAEVSAALGELSAAGGGPALARAANRLPLPAPAPGRPLIEELGANRTESDASSEGSAANALMASVDTLHPWFDAAGEGGALAEADSTFDLLATTITNVLNDERVVDTIQRRLLEDPAFAALLSRMGSPAAMPLLLEELSGDAEGGEGRGPGATGNPLVDLLQAIQGGIGVAAVQLGKAFLQLGHFLRGVGEHMSRTLAGLDGGRSGGGGEPQPVAVGIIIAKVAAAVGVLVLTRRVALARMVI